MNITKALLKVELISFLKFNHLKKDSSNKKVKNEVLLKLSIIGIFVILGIFFSVQIAYELINIGFEKLIFESIIPIVSIVVFFMILYKQFALFRRNDYDMLISLPLKISQIVFSKLFVFLLQSIIISFVLTFPAGIYYGIYSGQGILYYIMLLGTIILVPIIPFIAALLIGTLISYISSSIKNLNSSLLKIIIRVFIVILFGLAIGVYIFYMTKIENYLTEDMILEVINETSSIYSIIGIVNTIIYEMNILNFIVYVIFNVLMFWLSIEITAYFFPKINLKYMQSKSKGNYKVKNLKRSSKLIAITKVEIKRYFSIFIYVMNTMVTNVMALIVSVIIVIISPENIVGMLNIEGITADELTNIIIKFLPIILTVTLTVTNTTSASISIEGKSFWIVETLPMKTKYIYAPKIIVNLLISLPVVLISFIMFLFKFKLSFIEIIILFITPLSTIILMSLIGLVLNIRYPKFEFQTPTEVVKQGTPVLLSMVIGIIVDILLITTLSLFSSLGIIILDIVFVVLSLLIWNRLKGISINLIQNE